MLKLRSVRMVILSKKISYDFANLNKNWKNSLQKRFKSNVSKVYIIDIIQKMEWNRR